jgi:hypothetical protein
MLPNEFASRGPQVKAVKVDEMDVFVSVKHSGHAESVLDWLGQRVFGVSGLRLTIADSRGSKHIPQHTDLGPLKERVTGNMK